MDSELGLLPSIRLLGTFDQNPGRYNIFDNDLTSFQLKYFFQNFNFVFSTILFFVQLNSLTFVKPRLQYTMILM